MSSVAAINRQRLFTPGPINTSDRVRTAMMIDRGSRTDEFNTLTARVREALLRVAGAGPDHVAVLLQGSGSFAVEAMLTTLVSATGRVLVVTNGSYGDRIAEICAIHRIDHAVERFAECTAVTATPIEIALRRGSGFSHIAIVHCETSSGILNSVQDVLHLADRYHCEVLVDAMSTFGALPIDYSTPSLTAVSASGNKCLHGVPGLGFVIARSEQLVRSGPPRSLCLDLRAQFEEFGRSGQWRFTPPTHVLAALDEAIAEYEERGGQVARLAAYRARCRRLTAGMARLGYTAMVEECHQAPIIVAFRPPDVSRFDFDTVCRRLATRGLTIYPNKIAHAVGFRIGCIGEITEVDIDELLEAFAAIDPRPSCTVLGEVNV